MSKALTKLGNTFVSIAHYRLAWFIDIVSRPELDCPALARVHLNTCKRIPADAVIERILAYNS